MSVASADRVPAAPAARRSGGAAVSLLQIAPVNGTKANRPASSAQTGRNDRASKLVGTGYAAETDIAIAILSVNPTKSCAEGRQLGRGAVRRGSPRIRGGKRRCRGVLAEMRYRGQCLAGRMSHPLVPKDRMNSGPHPLPSMSLVLMGVRGCWPRTLP